MCGLQGSGKTTHSAKLAKYFKSQGHRPLLVACDIYRPAAIDQLKIVGEKAEDATNVVEDEPAGQAETSDVPVAEDTVAEKTTRKTRKAAEQTGEVSE